MLHSVYDQPDAKAVHAQFDKLLNSVGDRLPAVAEHRDMATELTACMQVLALTGTGARRWEPKRLRLRVFSVAGTIARKTRRFWLHLSGHAPRRHAFTTGLARLAGLPHPS